MRLGQFRRSDRGFRGLRGFPFSQPSLQADPPSVGHPSSHAEPLPWARRTILLAGFADLQSENGSGTRGSNAALNRIAGTEAGASVDRQWPLRGVFETCSVFRMRFPDVPFSGRYGKLHTPHAPNLFHFKGFGGFSLGYPHRKRPASYISLHIEEAGSFSTTAQLCLNTGGTSAV